MLYVTGDLHGDITRLETFRMRRLKKEDKLIVCGDFGFLWDNGESEKKALEKLAKKRYTILFVDGSHENFDLLEVPRTVCAPDCAPGWPVATLGLCAPCASVRRARRLMYSSAIGVHSLRAVLIQLYTINPLSGHCRAADFSKT